MKTLFRLSLLVLASVGLLVMIAIPVSAQEALSDEQRTRIRANCQTIKGTLTQLRASDALLRVNRGQAYEALGTKLMDRFNTRLTNNSLDARGLSSVSRSYDQRLATFRTNYEEYARQLEVAIRIDCSEDPDAFHRAVENARTKRAVLHEDVLALHAYIDDYRASLKDFKSDFQRTAENDND